MNTAAKLGTYVLGLAVVFGGTWGVGNLVGPQATPQKPATATHDMSQMSKQPTTAQKDSDTPGGLQVSQNGYTLNPLTAAKAGAPTDFQFTVTGPSGKPVTDYQVEHDKKLHFIVVSRDLSSFQHVHPEMSADGTWSVKIAFPAAGTFRAFADFTPTGGQALTLGADIQVAGDFQPKPLKAVSRTSEVDGYTVTLDGDLVPGQSSKLTLNVSKDGKPVTDLQPYLGAYGHLVALRAGDLAYLHVHPDGAPGDGKTQPGPGITFYAEAPSGGDYRLFLDFQHGGAVHTADFTAKAGEGTTAKPTAKPTAKNDHDSTPHGH
ncbi:hypothetical protein [Nonomuraea endophytica]|uniref:DUF748 domain-containing protein n=1 Tax=Nonomuraea endophytica TaxID=714136 RepID=A0A7W7ZY39_9ACTN|nr:hypothetical protein [Nonomuraea endophytica]MBB5075928.1 hypothetical protein [Nonomuraea endophytica]